MVLHTCIFVSTCLDERIDFFRRRGKKLCVYRVRNETSLNIHTGYPSEEEAALGLYIILPLRRMRSSGRVYFVYKRLMTSGIGFGKCGVKTRRRRCPRP